MAQKKKARYKKITPISANSCMAFCFKPVFGAYHRSLNWPLFIRHVIDRFNDGSWATVCSEAARRRKEGCRESTSFDPNGPAAQSISTDNPGRASNAPNCHALRRLNGAVVLTIRPSMGLR